MREDDLKITVTGLDPKIHNNWSSEKMRKVLEELANYDELKNKKQYKCPICECLLNTNKEKVCDNCKKTLKKINPGSK